MYSILFYIGPIPVRAYGLMLWIGMMIGLYRTVIVGKKQNIPADYVIDIALISVVAGIVGAHLTSTLLDLPYYINHPSIFANQWRDIFLPAGGLKGLSFHGGLIGGLLAGYIYCRIKKISFISMADLCTPAVALAYGITRIGCFLNGCCYGIPTNLPWAVQFPSEAVPGTLTPPSHPVQIYAFFISLVIYFILVKVENKRRFVGQVFFTYILLYGIYRFFIEFLRKGVTAEIAFLGLTQAQVVSLIMILVSGVILFAKRNLQNQRVD